MIKRDYDPLSSYKIAIYARMSDRKQNKRSPDQQIQTVKDLIHRCGYPWTIVEVYRDDGVKGRYIRKRKDLQRLLRDVTAALVQIDLIVVDTFERFGRADEFESIRRKLRVDHGVLVVCADNGFADPTGIVGKAVGMVEQIRSTEDGRVKAHNVLRGKKDTMRLKRWAGGPAPLGYRLKRFVDNSGPEPEMYSVAEPDPDSEWIAKKIFQKAYETGWGGTRLAKCFNNDPEIPPAFKPFYASSIDHMLGNELYIGVGIYGIVCTDIVNDARVIEPNPHPEDILRIEEYCQPLIAREVFETIRQTRQARKLKYARTGDGSKAGGKLIRPMAGGISLTHMLAGLVKCADCGACMVPRSSGRKSKAGTTYVYYTCPRHNGGACGNSHHLRIPPLEEAVLARLRSRLFPPSQTPGAVPPWFASLVSAVQQELNHLRQAMPRRTEEYAAKIAQIDQQLAGWTMSLGNPQLPLSLRQQLEASYMQACSDKAGFESELQAQRTLELQTASVLDPKQVLDGLKRLRDVLAADNVTLANLELARHIERIDCSGDGHIVLRGSYLGVFDGARAILSDSKAEAADSPDLSPPGTADTGRVQPRRLTRRKVPDLGMEQSLLPEQPDVALDPHRFAEVSDAFIWEEPFVLTQMPVWSRMNAAAVLQFVTDHPGANQQEVAEHFGKTRPTIRRALEIAKELQSDGTEATADSESSEPESDEESHAA